MVVTNYFQIANLSAPSSWIAFMVGVVLAYVAVRVRFGKPQGDRVADAFFTLVLIWKFSILLTDFKSVLRSPMAFIYFDGGTIGFFLGLLVIAMKVLWDWKKGRLSIRAMHALFTGAVIAQVLYQVMMVVLNDGEWVAQVVTVLFFGLFLLYFWLDSRNTKDMRSAIWLFMAVHLFVATVQPKGLAGAAFGATLVLGLFFGLLYAKGDRTVDEMEEHT